MLYFGIFSCGWLALHGVVPYPFVAVSAQALTVVAVYPLYRVVVFHATGSWVLGLIRFYTACVAILLFSICFLALLVEFARVPILMAQAVTVLGMPVITYPVQRFWTFRKPSRRRYGETAIGVGERHHGRLPQPTFGHAGDSERGASS
jgi:putative flippase GtrA